MAIYTKTGDSGETALFGGTRVPKNHPLIDLYGSIDELNSWIGLVAGSVGVEESRSFLVSVQEDLFRIGAHLSGSAEKLDPVTTRIPQMEQEIDRMESTLTPLCTFILPGGSTTASWAHITRSVARRVERTGVSLKRTPGLPERNLDVVLMYLNRLSDYLFVLARYCNANEHVEDVPWKGSENRKK